LKLKTYADIANDVDKWFDTSDYPKDHPSGLELIRKSSVSSKTKHVGNK